MGIPGDEPTQGLARGFVEGGEGLGIEEPFDRFGEGAGFVKIEPGDVAQPGPEGMSPDKNAVTPQFREDDLVKQRQGESEGAGAGDHEDGNEDLQGRGDPFARHQPDGGSAESGEEDGDEVEFADGMGGSGGGMGFKIVVRGSEKPFEERSGVGVASRREDGSGRAVAGSGGNGLAGEMRNRFGFAVDPIEQKRCGGGGQLGFDGDHASGSDFEPVPGLDAGEGDALAPTRGIEPQRRGDFPFAGVKLTAVAVEEPEMEIAPREHQKGEDRHEVEIEHALDAEEQSSGRTEPGGDESQGNGDIHVQGAQTQRGKGALEKIRTAHGESEGGRGEGDEAEEAGQFGVLLQPQVGRQGESHRVHREPGGDAEPGEQGATFRRCLLLFGAAERGRVSVAMEVPEEIHRGEFTGIPPQRQDRAGGVAVPAKNSGMEKQEVIDEPEAGGAGEVAETKGNPGGGAAPAGLFLGGGDGFGEFFEAVGVGIGIGGGLENATAEQFVKRAQAPGLDEVVDGAAPRAAESFLRKTHLEAVAAVVAGTDLVRRAADRGGGKGAGGGAHSISSSQRQVVPPVPSSWLCVRGEKCHIRERAAAAARPRLAWRKPREPSLRLTQAEPICTAQIAGRAPRPKASMVSTPRTAEPPARASARMA